MSETNLFASQEDQVLQAEIENVKKQFLKEDGTVDTEAILLSKAHANVHVKKVEGEAAALRKDLDTRLTYQDLLDKINAQRSDASSSRHDNDGVNDQNPKVLTEDVIDRIFEDKLNKRQQEAVQAANLQHVANELQKSWGPGWVDRLRAVGNQIHYTEQEIDRLAKTNPKALLSIALSQPIATGNQAPPATRVNTTASPSTGRRNWDYYKKLMKADPSKFDQLTKQMHDDAEAQGADFYN